MSPANQAPRWLLLVYQLPPRPTSARVKTWRRLQRLGAVSVRNAVYVLPDTDACREDFEWMKTEIQNMRGEVTVFTADSIDTFSNDDIVRAFRQARESDYAAVERDADALGAAAARRTGRGVARPQLARRARQLSDRLRELDAIAFYPPSNREAAATAVARVARAIEGSTPVEPSGDRLEPTRYQKRVWVTRPRPGIDRMSSAWLIRRFVDPRARFAFADTPPASGAAVPFDMYGVELGHSAHGCTFETLVARFGLSSPAVDRIAHVVHDLDLKESRYGAPEAAAFDHLVEGLRQIYADDGELLERGMVMFEAMYRSFSAGGDRPPEGRRSRRGRGRK